MAEAVDPRIRGSFGQMLKFLIANNIHPTDSDERKPWTQESLALALKLTDRVQVHRWASDKVLPPKTQFEGIIKLFFGKGQSRHENHKELFKSKYASAIASHNKYGNPALFAKSSTLLFWSSIQELTGKDLDVDESKINSKTIDEACWLLETKILKSTSAQVARIASDARERLFNIKYGDLQIDSDERHRLGIDGWTEEFSALLHKLHINFDSKLVNVGLGPGLEGKGIYEKFSEFVGVDLSSEALRRASDAFSNLQPVKAPAEDLPRAAENCDIYISLKTYSSSFFDIDSAIRSCAKCLRSGGIAIISVPRGYYRGNDLIPGLSATNYDFSSALEGHYYGVPDRMLPWLFADQIMRCLYKWLFAEIEVYTGRHEIYVSARKL